MDLKQIKADRDNGVIISRCTRDAVLDRAIELEHGIWCADVNLDAEREKSGERIAFLEARLIAMTQWLEANQVDVFSRGLWDAINASTAVGKPHGAT